MYLLLKAKPSYSWLLLLGRMKQYSSNSRPHKLWWKNGKKNLLLYHMSIYSNYHLLTYKIVFSYYKKLKFSSTCLTVIKSTLNITLECCLLIFYIILKFKEFLYHKKARERKKLFEKTKLTIHLIHFKTIQSIIYIKKKCVLAQYCLFKNSCVQALKG